MSEITPIGVELGMGVSPRAVSACHFTGEWRQAVIDPNKVWPYY